jgi:DNA-binding IclR family transcriptional regulator
MTSESTQTNQSVMRALSILDLVAECKDKLGVREIARRLGLATAVCQRLVITLTGTGYLERCEDSKKYRIGYKAFVCGSKYLTRDDINSASMPELRDLAELHRLNAYLGVLRERKAIYLMSMQSKSPIVIRGFPGESASLHSTALGKALMFDLKDDEINALLGPAPYPRLTDKTITSLKPFLTDLYQARRDGFSVSDGENLPDVLTLGAPIRDATGKIVAALSGAIHRNNARKEQIAALGAIVKDAALRVSKRLGAHEIIEA